MDISSTKSPHLYNLEEHDTLSSQHDESSVATEKTSNVVVDNVDEQEQNDEENIILHQDVHNTPTNDDIHKTNTETNHDSEVTLPILPTEKLNSSKPNQVRLSRDFIAQATGYHKSNLLLKYQ